MSAGKHISLFRSLPFILVALGKAMKMPKFKKCFKITWMFQDTLGCLGVIIKMEIEDGLWFFQDNHCIVYSFYFLVSFIIIAVPCL